MSRKIPSVLVACEYSGTVRDAFEAFGFEALSCDFLPTESCGWHYKGDVFDLLDYPFDLMIAHPPCTHLSASGSRHFQNKKALGLQQAAVSFFMRLTKTAIPRWAIENPVGVMSTLYRKPNQIIHPYQFGHDASKATCLWLNGLPNLMPTEMHQPRIVDGLPRWANQTDSGQNNLGPSEDRWKIRSATYPGIAKAMAHQWGEYILQNRKVAA